MNDDALIGRVTLKYGERFGVAELFIDGSWKFHGDEDIVDSLRLRTLVIDTSDDSPADGEYGYRFLHELAEVCEGTMEYIERPMETEEYGTDGLPIELLMDEEPDLNASEEDRYPAGVHRCGPKCHYSRFDSSSELLADALISTRNRKRFDSRGLRFHSQRLVLERLQGDSARWLSTRAWHLVEEIENRPLKGWVLIAIDRFFESVRPFLREPLEARARIVTGRTELSPAELESLEENVALYAAELEKLREATLAKGKPMNADFITRVEVLSRFVWSATQNLRRRSIIEAGEFKEEARIQGRSKNCAKCSPYSKDVAGWRPIGTLPDIGAPPRGYACKCYFVFR